MKETPNWQDALRAILPDDYQPDTEPQPQSELPKPRLSIVLDRKRAGKVATIITGFDDNDPRAAQLAGELKKHLAVGGSSRGGEILLQGDRTRQAAELLKLWGWKVINL